MLELVLVTFTVTHSVIMIAQKRHEVTIIQQSTYTGGGKNVKLPPSGTYRLLLVHVHRMRCHQCCLYAVHNKRSSINAVCIPVRPIAEHERHANKSIQMNKALTDLDISG